MNRLISFLVILLISFSLIAQVSDSLDIDEITVAASKATAADPVTFQNISAKQIDGVYYGQNPVALIERLAPSVVTYGDGGANLGNYVNFRMRGINHTRINKTLDGVPLDDMVDQATYFSNFSDFGNSLGGIQVQRGVGTSNNGIASYGGAINFESPKLYGAERGGELQLLRGSFNTLRGAAEVRTGLMDNKLSFYGRMSRTTSDGFKDVSSSDATGFFVSGAYFGDKDIIKFTAFSGKSERGQAYQPVLLSDIQANPRTNYQDPDDIDDFEQELVSLKYSRIINSSLTWNNTAYYGGARGVFPFSFGGDQFNFGVENDHFGFFSDVNYQKDGLNIKGGFHVYTFDRLNYEYIAPDVNDPYDSDTTDKNEVSAFAKANYQVGKISLTADVQLRNVSMDFSPTDISSRSTTFFNPKIGITYNLDAKNSLYASFGRTGREPTRSDIRRDDNIKNEFVNDIELGWRASGDNFAINANFFFMDFKNEISLVGALQERTYFDVRTNVASSNRKGLELQSAYNLSESVTFGLNAAYLSTNVSEYQGLTDVEQTFSPNLIISPDLKLLLTDDIKLNLSGQYVSESFIELSNQADFTAPSFFIANAQLDVSLTSALSLTATVNNVFDKLYFTDGAVVDADFDGTIDGPGYRVQPPRNAYVMLRWNF